MVKPAESTTSFNLWNEPWITLEQRAGGTDQGGIEHALLHAQDYTAIYEPSPLVVVGIHRLLTAILLDALKPRTPGDLQKLLDEGCFPIAALQAFGQRYMDRFDLFSAAAPLLQSADLPLQPARGDKVKAVTYLAMERPSGTAVTHFCHGGEDVQVFCPACAAGGLAMIPAFATSGGAGIKPSINGVPPIYVIPRGKSLFESLVLSMICPPFQPKVADKKNDTAWWAREPIVERSKEVLHVGYLHSLTFPARRVRLHPEKLNMPCTRCGRTSAWGVRTMIFEMGESRPKDAEFWQDPFAAYRLPDAKSDRNPTPIRPLAGKAAWREFAGLFMANAEERAKGTLRPRVLDQLGELDLSADDTPLRPFRCVGIMTDMKAKIFEWIDASFEVPTALLKDWDAGECIREAIDFAAECSTTIKSVFSQTFGASRKQERNRTLKGRMEEQYWSTLSGRFRELVLDLGRYPRGNVQRQEVCESWKDTVVAAAREAFRLAAEMVGDDATSLRGRVRGQTACERLLAWIRKGKPKKKGAKGE